MKNLKYHQPLFYHFNQDSIALVNFVFEVHKNNLEKLKILDLMSGCGIIGFELMLRSKKKIELTFVELQKEYFTFWQKNKDDFFANEKIVFINCDYQLLPESFDQSFNLIMCNPPYFVKDDGRQSRDVKRNICRHFIVGDMDSLLRKILKLLKLKGSAYILTRDFLNIKDPIENIKVTLVLDEAKRKIYCIERFF